MLQAVPEAGGRLEPERRGGMVPETLDFVVPRHSKCNADGLASCLKAAADPDVALIDLSEATWFEPLALVGVAAFIERAINSGRGVEVVGPSDWSVANYLSRMRLGLVIEDQGGAHNLNHVHENDLGGALLELQRFEGEVGVELLAGMVFDKLNGTDPQTAQALYTSIIEIGANVPQHSGLASGFMAAQSTYRGNCIHFAVGDAGDGLYATLRDSGATSEAHALELVLEQDGVTRTRQAGRGIGIRETRRLAVQTGGFVHMVSGNASRTARDGSSASRMSRHDFPGALLQGKLFCDP
jgi:hypothetical protein